MTGVNLAACCHCANCNTDQTGPSSTDSCDNAAETEPGLHFFLWSTIKLNIVNTVGAACRMI